MGAGPMMVYTAVAASRSGGNAPSACSFNPRVFRDFSRTPWGTSSSRLGRRSTAVVSRWCCAVRSLRNGAGFVRILGDGPRAEHSSGHDFV
eukprot:3256155-Pyramimonas_sp.AAC.1